MNVKFQQWVASVRRRMQDGQPLMGPDSLQALTDDVRKLGLGAMGAGVLAFIAPSEKITFGASAALFILGAIIWVTGIALHARFERNSAEKKGWIVAAFAIFTSAVGHCFAHETISVIR